MTLPLHRDFPTLPHVLVAALKIVMNNNHIKFGDIFVHQLHGITIGMSPATTVANMFVSLNEQKEMLPKCISSLHLYRGVIDDAFAIRKHDRCHATDLRNYKAFKKTVNSCGVRWIFIDSNSKVGFMDLTVNTVGHQVITNLYDKPLALHLYIHPHPCRLSSCVRSLVTGTVLWIHHLYTFQRDIAYWPEEFYHHLLNQGCLNDQGLLLFSIDTDNVLTFLSIGDKYCLQQKRAANSEDNIFLHLKVRSCSPQSPAIQKLWREMVMQPQGKDHLLLLWNFNKGNIKATKLIVAYKCHSKVDNLLSYQKICKRLGLKVSSFFTRY
jgi:hypothetical protein